MEGGPKAPRGGRRPLAWTHMNPNAWAGGQQTHIMLHSRGNYTFTSSYAHDLSSFCLMMTNFGQWMKTFTFATGTNFEESRAQTLFWGDAEPLVGRVLLFAGQNRTRRCEAIGRDSFYLHVFLKLHVDRPGRQINDGRLTKLKYFRNSNVSPTKAALLRPSGISLFNDKYGRNFAVRTLLFSFFWPVWGIPLILLLNKGVYTASANWPGRCFSSPAQQLSNNILQTFHLTLVWESKQRASCVPLQEEEFLFWEALKRCAVCRFCQPVLNTEMNGLQWRANRAKIRTLHQAKKPADRGH